MRPYFTILLPFFSIVVGWPQGYEHMVPEVKEPVREEIPYYPQQPEPEQFQPPPSGAQVVSNTSAPIDKALAMFKLPDSYSVHKPPPLIDGEPISVEFGMLVFNIFDIKELLEEVSLEVNYKLYWKDIRLKNWTKNIEPGDKFTSLSTTLIHRIWHPDIFIDHIKRVTQPQLISQASSLRLYNDGSLRWTARTLLVLTCRMDFHYYPADTQQCNVTLKSFAFSTRQMNLAWRDQVGALLAKSMDAHNFDVALETFPDYLQITKSNNYTTLSFGIRLRRRLSYHIIQTYVPSTMFTIVSWLSFLLPPDSTPGRMAICVTTLLTVTAMFGSTKQNTPNVSYIKALDIWMFMCIFFIFLSLAEFTLVLKLRSKKLNPKQAEKGLRRTIKNFRSTVRFRQKAKPDPNADDCNHCTTQANNLDNLGFDSKPPRPPKAGNLEKAVMVAPSPAPPKPPGPTKYFVLSTKIEKYAPRFIPLLFVTLVSIYWPYLLIASGYYELNMTEEMYYTVPKRR